MTEIIHIDGRTLEGGGQLLRLSLSLSSLTKKSFNITDIRGNRGIGFKAGQAGGMKPAHLAAATWLAKATNASTEGLELRSRKLEFRPSNTENEDNPERVKDITWSEIHEAGKTIRREARIDIGSPGSALLVLQAVFPYILYLHKRAANEVDNTPYPVRITISGGTNVWHSLSYEYADQVLFPMLHKKLGLGPFSLKLHNRGWSSGRSSIGKIELEFKPLGIGQAIPEFDYTNRGEIITFHISILAPDERFRSRIKELVASKLLRLCPDADIEFPVYDFSGHPKRLYLLVVAESSNGFRLGRDWLFDEKINNEKPQKTIETLVTKVVRDIDDEISHGGCVDEWLQDQLYVHHFSFK
jgi:RNA 3'-terminal phosphate cyclase (ATP)